MRALMSLVPAAVISLAGIFSHPVHALPQLTPQCADKVVQPKVDSEEGKLDAGYTVSSDCSVIYVHPPVKGLSRLTAIATTASVSQCPGIKDIMDAGNIAARNTKVAQTKAGEALQKGDLSMVTTLQVLANGFKTQFDQINDTLSPFAKIESATSSVLLSIPYAKLLASYSELNPKKNIQKLPIKGGYLTVSVKVPDALDPFGAEAATRSATLEVKALGVVGGAAGTGNALNKGIGDFNVVSPDGTATINFGDSSSGQVRLSLFGVCPFYDEAKKMLVSFDFGKRDTSILAYLAATYTYYYPVQTRGAYRITYSADVLADIVQKLVETKTGDISAMALAANIFDVNGTEAFNIIVEQDLLNSIGDTGDLLTKFKADLTNSFVNDVLSKFADVTKNQAIPDVDSNLTGFTNEVRTARHCRSSGFLGLGRSCSDNVYTVKVPISTVKERVKEVLGELHLRYSVSAVKLTTVIMTGTTGFDVVLEP